MIKLRLNSIVGSDEIIKTIPNEDIESAVYRALEIQGYAVDENILNLFIVIFNGHPLEREFWKIVPITEADEVLIAPRLMGGDFGQIFKTFVIIVATVAATYFLGPAGAGLTGATLGAATAAVSIGTTLLMNALIPPPTAGFGNVGGLGDGYSSSQMFSITAQSNATKKYGSVPKVYGTHRIYPTIAANPYVEIEADPETGNLVQFFYAIYDFGLGTNIVNEIKLGDTPLSNFSDVEYRLVDPNKPTISTGAWDDGLFDSFALYKGDHESDSVSSVLNVNSVDAGAVQSDYQVIRNASSAVNGDEQEISLDFVNPNGLIAYGTNGDSTSRSIELEIHFSKVGEDIWRPYNDFTYVKSFKAVGGYQGLQDVSVSFYPYTTPSATPPVYPLLFDFYWEGLTYRTYGYGVGNSTYILSDNVSVGQYLYYRGRSLGKVLTKAPYATGYSTYTTDSSLTEILNIYSMQYEGVTYTNVFNEYSSMYTKIPALGKAIIERRSTDLVYSTFKFEPKEIAQYKIRIKRVRSTSSYTSQVQDKLTLASIICRFNRNPILTDKRHVFLELKIRATNQLNGTIQNLSAICTSVLDVYNVGTSQWEKQPTANPAWIFCDLLTGDVNKRAIAKSRLHLPSIIEWADYCDEVPTPPPGNTYIRNRFSCNFVLDFNTTLQGLLNSVTHSSQASLNIIDGKYGVLLDVLRTTPVQIFTPRNSWGFTSSRVYVNPPHGLKVKYTDPNSEWQQNEHIVYYDGYDATNATEFEEMESFGVTNYEQAWRFGRYSIAQAMLRQETIAIEVDFEYLVCTRGDYVQFTHDVMKTGGRPARVKSIVGSTIEIDDGIDTDNLLSYGYVFRSPTGIYTDTLTVVDSSHFTLDGTLPSVGDLIIIGEVGQVVIDCIVKSITPNGDLTASLILIEKADAVYTAESTSTIPAYSPIISLTQDSINTAPGEVQSLAVIENTWRCLGDGYEFYIKLDWDTPTGSAYELFEIYVSRGLGYNLYDYSKTTEYKYVVDQNFLNQPHSFKVLAVSSNGKKLEIGQVGYVTATPLPKTTPPSDVEALYINVTGEVLQLDWPLITDCDCDEYLIRYSPNLSATWETSVPLLRAAKNQTIVSVQARTGMYLIKAIDFAGNESYSPAMARTSIPELFNLNVIDEIDDFPTLAGSKDRVVNFGNTLMLQESISGGPGLTQYHSEGYYYMENLLDLGDIYTVRLQALIEAEGYTADDLMVYWTTLTDLDAMSNSKFSEWDVEIQYRATNQYVTMASWTTLSSVTFLNSGVDDIWTPWRKLTNTGDFTGRVFQFRIKLISNLSSVTPRVLSAVIKADMPDRRDAYNNITSSPSGTTVTYSTPFKGPGTSPNVQITSDNMQSGDYYQLTAKTLAGFTITFYDNNDVAVSRQFDVQVQGYGAKSSNTI